MRFKSSNVQSALLCCFVSSLFLICNCSQFTWIEDNSFYDCIVGLVLDKQPIGMGVRIGGRSVLSSASPIDHKNWTSPQGNVLGSYSPLQMYVVDGVWNKAKPQPIERVMGNQLNRNQRRVRVGFDSRHSTAYDYIYFVVDFRIRQYTIYDKTKVRYPIPVDMARLGLNYDPYGWKIAAFGYTDRAHVKRSLALVITTYYSETPLENCDEWIPRPWGRFLCLNNVDNFPGIQSGAALFNRNLLYGFGAFEITKGTESILVFTDMRYYRDKLWAVFTDIQ